MKKNLFMGTITLSYADGHTGDWDGSQIEKLENPTWEEYSATYDRLEECAGPGQTPHVVSKGDWVKHERLGGLVRLTKKGFEPKWFTEKAFEKAKVKTNWDMLKWYDPATLAYPSPQTADGLEYLPEERLLQMSVAEYRRLKPAHYFSVAEAIWASAMEPEVKVTSHESVLTAIIREEGWEDYWESRRPIFKGGEIFAFCRMGTNPYDWAKNGMVIERS